MGESKIVELLLAVILIATSVNCWYIDHRHFQFMCDNIKYQWWLKRQELPTAALLISNFNGPIDTDKNLTATKLTVEVILHILRSLKVLICRRNSQLEIPTPSIIASLSAWSSCKLYYINALGASRDMISQSQFASAFLNFFI